MMRMWFGLEIDVVGLTPLCDLKSQLSGILTEPLNPRDVHTQTIYRIIYNSIKKKISV